MIKKYESRKIKDTSGKYYVQFKVFSKKVIMPIVPQRHFHHHLFVLQLPYPDADFPG